MRNKKVIVLVTLLSVLALASCDTSDAGTPQNSLNGREESTPENTRDNSLNAEVSNRDASDKAIDSSFEYTLIEEENTVLLTNYIGHEEQVTVYGSYKIGEKEYKTRLQDGTIDNIKTSPFRDNTTITSISFVGGVKLDNCSEYFSYCTNLETVDFSGLDTSGCTDFSAMFSNCTSLQALDLSPLNTDSLEELSGMFSFCDSLTELDLSMIDTSRVTSFACLFEHCISLETVNLENINTSNAQDFISMFDGCSSLSSIDVSGFDTSNTTIMNAMFSGCSGLTNLDVSNFDTRQVAYMYAMFGGCSSLTSLDLSNFDTQQVENMSAMFSGCSNLTSIDLNSFDTHRVKDMSEMFKGCGSLEQLDISHFTPYDHLTHIYSMFEDCERLAVVYVNQDFYDHVYSDRVQNSRDLFEDSLLTDFTVK